MEKGILVYHKNFERGIVEKLSPSGFIISVRFKHFGFKTVLNSTLTIIK